jgi:hypothetical protein
MAGYRLLQAARMIGVAPITLKRWLLSGKVAEVQRDRNGWRIFQQEDVERIREYATMVCPPPDRAKRPLLSLTPRRPQNEEALAEAVELRGTKGGRP